MTNQDLLLPFCKNVQTRQPQLASDSFFEVKLGTLSKYYIMFQFIYIHILLQPSLIDIHILLGLGNHESKVKSTLASKPY